MRRLGVLFIWGMLLGFFAPSAALATCLSDFWEQPSYPQSGCLTRPPGSVCVGFGFSPTYVWLIEDTVVSGGNDSCEGLQIDVVVGGAGEYHHVPRTNLVKFAPFDDVGCMSRFFSQPSFSVANCSVAPAGSVCAAFPDGFTWLVHDSLTGSKAAICDGVDVQVRVGARGEYHHIPGTHRVAFVPVAPLLPLTIELNQNAFGAGTALILTAAVAPDSSLPPLVDVYVVLQVGDESFFSLLVDGSIIAGITPLASGVPWPTAPFRAEIFRYTLLGSEPPGSYKWLAALVATGTTTLVSAVSEVSFHIDTGLTAPTVPVPITPTGNAAIRQNDPTIGCSPSPTRGLGFRIVFDWTESSSPHGVAGYQIIAKHVDAAFPIVNTFGASSQFVDKSCNGFVADENLNDWTWRVRAQDALGNFSDWSETATFRFEPCRLGSGRPCFAP